MATKILVSLMSKCMFCNTAFMFLSILSLQRFKMWTFFAKAKTEGNIRQEIPYKTKSTLRNSLLVTATQQHSLLTESNLGIVCKLLIVAASTEICLTAAFNTRQIKKLQMHLFFNRFLKEVPKSSNYSQLPHTFQQTWNRQIKLT